MPRNNELGSRFVSFVPRAGAGERCHSLSNIYEPDSVKRQTSYKHTPGDAEEETSISIKRMQLPGGGALVSIALSGDGFGARR